MNYRFFLSQSERSNERVRRQMNLKNKFITNGNIAEFRKENPSFRKAPT